MNSKFFPVLLIILLSGATAACTLTQQPTATFTASPLPSSTNTPLPPSPTRTEVPTSTGTSTPRVLELEIYGVGWLGSGDLLITLQGVEPFNESYYLELAGYQYNCRVAEDSDRLLFCAGRIAPQGANPLITLLLAENDREVFQTRITVPYKPASDSSGSAEGTPDMTPDMTPDLTPVTSPVPTT